MAPVGPQHLAHPKHSPARDWLHLHWVPQNTGHCLISCSANSLSVLKQHKYSYRVSLKINLSLAAEGLFMPDFLSFYMNAYSYL